MKKIFFLIIALFSSITSAECYTVGHLQGYQTTKGNNYEFVASEFSGQEFNIYIDGPRSYATPRGQEICTEINKTAISCSFVEGSKGLIEVWSLDLARQTVIYTKHRTGFDYGLDGAVAFKGKIIGTCK